MLEHARVLGVFVTAPNRCCAQIVPKCTVCHSITKRLMLIQGPSPRALDVMCHVPCVLKIECYEFARGLSSPEASAGARDRDQNPKP